MALSTLRKVRFSGMASCVPKSVISNLDCPAEMKSERERLVRNIGILHRRICYPWQYFSELAQTAGERLLSELGWAREEVDALIVVTQSPDYPIPATAIIIQDRMKLAQTTLAFDVNLGCSGYPYGIYILGSMIAAGAVKKGLVLVGDKSARLLDPLFSDCATATALEFDGAATPMYFDLNSDGSGYRAIIKPVGGHREETKFHHFVPGPGSQWERKRQVDVILDGTAVLNFSITRVPSAIKNILEFCGTALTDVDYFVFHQANKMINETIRKKLGLPSEKVPSTLHDFGNTSSATVPLTMTVRLREELSAGKKRLLLCGFGIGLSWATSVLDIDRGCFPPLIEA